MSIGWVISLPEYATSRDMEQVRALWREAVNSRGPKDVVLSAGITVTDMRRKGDVTAALLRRARSRVR